ncbi:MAG: protein kinase [Erysipelotrichales bacterium]|nr:protein kinase [Erysipelotrichales bacterium]
MNGNVSLFDPAVYQELYHLDGAGRSVVMDRKNQRICVRKVLDVYNPEVFAWLGTHHHPHVAAVYETEKTEDGKLAVLEEFTEGETLEKLLDQNVLSGEEKFRLLLEILDGVSFLHSAEPPIIHRDLKPSNIIVSKDRHAKVIDYDAAKIYRADEKRDTVLIGTEGSAAPEQYGFGSSARQTDIYGLGILIKKMFPEESWVKPVITKATKIDPDDRYDSVPAMKASLKNRYAFRHIPVPEVIRFNIPGFRSGNLWYSLLALAGYGLLLWVILSFEVHDANGELVTGRELLVYQVTLSLIAVAEIDLWSDWTHLFKKCIPVLSHDNPAVRIIAMAVTAAVLPFVIIFLMALIIIIFFRH